MHLLSLLQTLPFRSRVELKQTHTDLQNCLLALPTVSTVLCHGVTSACTRGAGAELEPMHGWREWQVPNSVFGFFLGLQSTSSCAHNSPKHLIKACLLPQLLTLTFRTLGTQAPSNGSGSEQRLCPPLSLSLVFPTAKLLVASSIIKQKSPYTLTRQADLFRSRALTLSLSP